MRVPACRIYSVGQITSWAKQFLNSLQKESVIEVTFEPSVQKFCEGPSPHVAVVFIENAPDMKQAIAKLRQSGKSLLLVWYGKLFSKEELAFALEHRVYAVIESPRPEDARVLEHIKRVARASEHIQHFEQHFHSLKAILLQGESEEALKPLINEFKTVLSKLERTGLQNEFLGTQIDMVHGDGVGLPFHKAQDFGDALVTVHELERTGTLRIRGALQGQEGRVEFLQGKIVAAAAGDVRSLKAIYRMFLWDEPKFAFIRIDPQDYVLEDHLNVSLKYVRMEGDDLRRRYQKIRRELPPSNLELELLPNALHAGTQLPPEDFSTLTSVVESRTVNDVLDGNLLADVTLYEALIRLRKANMIRVA